MIKSFRLKKRLILAVVKTTCARVILMALTGDGSMSTNCSTELRVWHTHTQTYAHTHTCMPKAGMQTHQHEKVLMEKRKKCQQDLSRQTDKEERKENLLLNSTTLTQQRNRRSEKSTD